jgi:hypothetical protein
MLFVLVHHSIKITVMERNAKQAPLCNTVNAMNQLQFQVLVYSTDHPLCRVQLDLETCLLFVSN